MTDLSRRPHRLGPNQVPVYYAGGERIDRFRGESGDVHGPEDWVASVTTFPAHLIPPGGDPETGVSRLLDGTSLRAAVEEDPDGWLGPALTAAYGEPALLVKLLDAGERLPVHCHPTREIAREKLGSQFGKNEGWIILGADNAEMWLGFRREVNRTDLTRWIEAQDVDVMLDAMNRIDVRAGDVLYVPAGTPHSFGPGVLLLELQEPTSFSILAEYQKFALTPEQATLGLSWKDAISCFDLQEYDSVRMTRLRPQPQLLCSDHSGKVWRLFDVEADPYFRAIRVEAVGELPLDDWHAFSVLLVTQGQGSLCTSGGDEDIRAGQTWVVPYAAGPLTVRGEVEMIVCVPPVIAG